MLEIEKNQMIGAMVVMWNNGVKSKLTICRTILKMFPQAFMKDAVEAYKEFISREWIVVDNFGLYEVKNGKDEKVATFYSADSAAEYVKFKIESHS